MNVAAEKLRICAAGGYVDYGRVNGNSHPLYAKCTNFSQGNLALSRALGDFEFKQNASLGPEQQIITADPEITCHEINEEDEFLVLACDGLSYVRNHLEISHVFFKAFGIVLPRNKWSISSVTKCRQAKSSQR